MKILKWIVDRIEFVSLLIATAMFALAVSFWCWITKSQWMEPETTIDYYPSSQPNTGLLSKTFIKAKEKLVRVEV